MAHINTGHPVTLGRSEVMSKSKKNVVDPGRIIENYGADTARLFMLSDSPPERDLEWTDSGIDGSWRYINRLWRMVAEAELPAPGTVLPEDISDRAMKIRQVVHRAIADVSQAFERFHFNGAVAKVRELSNALEELASHVKTSADAGETIVLREGLETLSLLLGPMLPHIAEELWAQLGHKTLLCETEWPTADVRLLVDNTVTVAIQVNGKLRATITLPRDATAKDAENAALADPAIVRFLDGRTPKRVIVIPNKIINVVAG